MTNNTVEWLPECVDFRDTCVLDMSKDSWQLVTVKHKCSLHKEVADETLVNEIIEKVCKPRTLKNLIHQAVYDL